VLFDIQSVIDKHDLRGQLRLMFPTEPWERRLYVSPRLDRATANAVTEFVSKSLALQVTTRQPITHYSRLMGS
jgi:hypothetical protein